jgi:hypothetical protein
VRPNELHFSREPVVPVSLFPGRLVLLPPEHNVRRAVRHPTHGASKVVLATVERVGLRGRSREREITLRRHKTHYNAWKHKKAIRTQNCTCRPQTALQLNGQRNRIPLRHAVCRTWNPGHLYPSPFNVHHSVVHT